MPNTTRTAPKGIPPRVRQPKPAAKNKKIAKAKPSKKRVADSDNEIESSESESVKVKKKPTKKRRTVHEEPAAESDVEIVDGGEPLEPEVEEVDGHSHENQSLDEQNVSIYVYCYSKTYNCFLGR
jgi:hypothetical protein